MAKQGMKHYYTRHEEEESLQVPVINGKSKSGKVKARNLIAGENGKVFHGSSHKARPKTPVHFSFVDNDLAVENLCNDFDIDQADLQDLK